MATLPAIFTHTPVHPSFTHDVLDTHLIYDYHAPDAQGNPQKWRFELWSCPKIESSTPSMGGPMQGRRNYQTCCCQCIRPGEVWQCGFLEETGNFVSLLWDIPGRTITTAVAFSKGHWELPSAARGDKRNPEDLTHCKGLARLGIQTERMVVAEEARVVRQFKGARSLELIAPDAATF